MEPENDEGNIEYKLKLINIDDDIINRRSTQMKYRVYEGNGEALYFIGVTDKGKLLGLSEDEYIESVNNLKIIADKIDCSLIKISETNIKNFYIGEFLIRENDNVNYIDLKITIAGNVDSGKSSTIGTLTKGILDNGRGLARTHVFNYKHEIETGRSSSIGHQIMGFDKNGIDVNSRYDRNATWAEIVNNSTKIITFFDLVGHEKYLRTTIHGLSSMYPDYCLIMISANTGINHMTREHVGLCINLKIPIIIVLTKIDIVPENILEETMSKINNMCKNKMRKIPFTVKNKSDIINVVKNIKSDSIVPIIQISNVNGFNLDLLKTMLNLLPIRNDYSQFINQPVELLIDSTYAVTGHTTIVSGLLTSGTIKINDTLALGPFNDGNYRQVKVRSIHCKYKDIKESITGSYICISLKNVLRREIKKGMMLVSDIPETKISIKRFDAIIHILHSPTTIKVGYQPFVHIGNVKQAVKMIEINKINLDDNIIDDHILRNGDKANVKLEFIIKPEYIKNNMKIIFREGKIKAVGKVTIN